MNTKIVSILPLFLTISCIKADVNFDINDPNFNLGSDTLTKQYASLFQQFSREKLKAYRTADKQIEQLLNPTALKVFDNIAKQKGKECFQQSWIYQTIWGDNGYYHTNSASCKLLREVQEQALKDLKTANEWSNLKPFLQNFSAYRALEFSLHLIFIVNDNKNIPQESKKEKIHQKIDEWINKIYEDKESIVYSENITPEAKEWIKTTLNPIIEDICKVVN
jgi:hypothetical protein